MRSWKPPLTVVLLALLMGSAVRAQTAPATAAPSRQPAAARKLPDFSGFWEVRGGSPSWDPADPQGNKPEDLPMTPWALAKLKEARPPFGLHQTFADSNDAVQKYCDPPGIPRIYNYPWQFTLVQTPKIVYILYEFSRVWRSVALNQDHAQDLDSSWMGDSVGRYEGESLVVDTRGFNDKTWIDQVGHPHSDQLHLIERFRRVDSDTLELSVTFEDPKAFTKSFTGKRIFKLSSAPVSETVCSYSEMQAFQNEVISTTTKPKHTEELPK